MDSFPEAKSCMKDQTYAAKITTTSSKSSPVVMF